MSITDTTYRAFYETFRDIAMDVQRVRDRGANVPPARVVYQADDPVLYDKLTTPTRKDPRTTSTSRPLLTS
jgi:hypothetical protein